MTTAYACYEEDGGRATVTFARELAQAPDRVWQALTDARALEHWFPAVIEGDLRPGGAVRFVFADPDASDSAGEITEFEVGSRLTFTWGKDILRSELEPTPGGTRLHFTQLLARPDHAARDAAGWHVCLDRLTAHLAGDETTAPPTEPTPEWQALHDAYAQRGFPAGAEPA